MPELAKLLNISERQVYKLAASNRIPSFKIGGFVRFDPSAFAAWLRGRMVPVPVRSVRAVAPFFPHLLRLVAFHFAQRAR